MIKKKQNSFYEAVGKALTKERTRRRMSIADLVKASGEQHKTITSIEGGSVCSLHHLVWMKSILGLDINNIIEGDTHEEDSRLDDLI
jgi:predicted transcriptional regulator